MDKHPANDNSNNKTIFVRACPKGRQPSEKAFFPSSKALKIFPQHS